MKNTVVKLLLLSVLCVNGSSSGSSRVTTHTAGVSNAIYSHSARAGVSLHLTRIKETVSVEIEKSEIVGEMYTEIPEYFELLCRVVEAEAGNQDELGRAYVADVVLNRARLWDKGVVEVLYSPNAFSCVSNHAIYRVTVKESTKRIVLEELQNQRNCDILYFRTNHFHTFGTPLFKHGDHYFSK